MVALVATIFAQPGPATARQARPVGIPGDVDIIAYTADSRFMGRLPAGACPRGLDHLGELRTLSITGGSAWPLGNDGPVGRDQVTIPASDLLAFELVEPAAEPPPLRRPRFTHSLSLSLGPYHVQGDIRVRPGRDPIDAFDRAEGLVVLRDAWIEYPVGDARRRRLANRLVVNRARVGAFWLASDLDPDARDYQRRLSALLRDARRRVQR